MTTTFRPQRIRSTLLTSAAVVFLLTTGAECGIPDARCIDFRGRTIELRLADPEACVAECGDHEIRFPETVQLFVTDEVGYLREWYCDIPRAEIVTAFPGLTLERRSYEDAGLWLRDGTQMTLGEHVVLDAAGCSGELYGNVSTIPFHAGPSDPDVWLQPSDEPDFDVNFVFYPDDRFACGLPELCVASACRAYGVAVE